MTKNKIIKWLKIFAVFGPLLFNFTACLVSSLSVGNMFAVNGENNLNLIASNYIPQIENFVVTIGTECFSPYVNITMLNQFSTTPILYTIVNFTTNMAVGMPLGDIISLDNVWLSNCVGFLSLIVYYLFVEFIFFIPEVLIMFVRWSKSLLYKFMDKGGFDA